MARIRSIKPSFFHDVDISGLSFGLRLMFIGLWCHADKVGRLVDDPRYLKSQLFSSDLSEINKRVDVEKNLQALEIKPFIQRYSIDGKNYIQIINFSKHQKPHHTEAESVIPPPNGEITVKQPLDNAQEGKGREGKGEVIPPTKDRHLDFVLLTKEEHQKLADEIGAADTKEYIDRLNNYIGAKGRQYKSHYHAIRTWYKKDHPKTETVVRRPL